MHKKFTLAKTVACLFFVACLWQNTNAQKQPDTKDITSLLDKNAPAVGMSSYDRDNTRVQNAYYSSQSGITLVYLQQTYKGIDVHTALKVLAFKGDKLVSVSGTLEPKMDRRANNKEGKPGLLPQNAVSSAAKHLNLRMAAQFAPLKYSVNGRETVFGNLGIAADSIRTKLLWIPAEGSNKMILCWQVQIRPNKSPDHWLVRVDANTGEVVNKSNITVKCSWAVPHKHTADCYEDREYDNGANNAAAPEDFKDPDAINSAKYRVVPFPAEAPSFPGGTPAVVTNPWLLSPAGSPATTLKWNDDGTSYAITRGNNVYAQEDHDADDNTLGQPGKSKTGVPDLNFDYLPNFAGEPSDSLNEGFALTNLFYWNNIMHDITYQYGFDEVAGNFQQNNLSRGGADSDPVIADGQDAEALNNANFGTPPDGQSPRMQMFLFNTGGDGKGCLVNAPASIKGYKQSVEGDLSTHNRLSNVGPVTANLALYKDASGNNRACAVSTNQAELAGKIALIFRAGCDFVVKIKNAQNAGAIGVIMVDTVVGEAPFSMGAANNDNTITIPGVMIGKADGDAIRNLLNGGTTVNATLTAEHQLDGSLDVGVMNHEYTHGISNRLVGGPSNTACLELNTIKEQMGEGWSDYFALMTTTDWTKAQLTDGAKARPLGTYVLGETPTGGGIRNYPYSTNMAINPWTYGKMKSYPNIEEHTVGEVWCVALWDMTWNIIQQDGVINTNFFNANNAGGNSVAMKLVTEGMKLTKCSPGFVDGRDAILKADSILYNGKYSCAIWKAFAKRGVGLKASEGSSKSITDQVEDFTLPTFVTLTKHVGVDSVAQNGELNYTITATCTCADRTGLKITDTLPANVTYVSGDGIYNSANRTVTFSGINLGASKSASYKIKVKVNGGTYYDMVTHLSDAVTQSTIPAATWQSTSNSGTGWFTTSASFKSASLSYFAKDSTVPSVKTLATTKAYPVSGLTILSFWHFYNVESLYDGGVIEGSTDNGATWVDLGKYIITNGYNNTIDTGNGTVLAGKRAFTGSSGTFINTKVNLSVFGGKNLKIRFKLVTDDGTGIVGWYVDDISLTSTAGVYNMARLYSSTDSLENTGDTITFIKKGPLPVTWGGFTAEKDKATAHLTWKTTLELNTDKFMVERSADGISYTAIGLVKAAGSSNSTISYQYDDIAPLQGINYYRIKQLDKDGQFDYSPIRYLTFGDANGVSITPNPAKDKITVTVAGNTKPLKVYLVTNTGQRLTSYDMPGASLNIILPPLAAGVYYVRIEGPGTSSQHKLIIK